MLCFVVLLGLFAGLQACDPQATTDAPFSRPKFHANYDRMSDIWLGELEFIDFFCGWPYDVPQVKEKRAVPEETANVVDVVANTRLTPDDINTLKLDHSFVYFRGETFEWGASIMVNFTQGTIDRDASLCDDAMWRRQGNSACSLEQARTLAARFWETFGEYNLLTNNCHNFAEWFMDHLSSGHCKF